MGPPLYFASYCMYTTGGSDLRVMQHVHWEDATRKPVAPAAILGFSV